MFSLTADVNGVKTKSRDSKRLIKLILDVMTSRQKPPMTQPGEKVNQINIHH